jgi:hypothetical protein
VTCKSRLTGESGRPGGGAKVCFTQTRGFYMDVVKEDALEVDRGLCSSLGSLCISAGWARQSEVGIRHTRTTKTRKLLKLFCNIVCIVSCQMSKLDPSNSSNKKVMAVIVNTRISIHGEPENLKYPSRHASSSKNSKVHVCSSNILSTL